MLVRNDDPHSGDVVRDSAPYVGERHANRNPATVVPVRRLIATPFIP
jgi:hypothetical protein